MAFECRHCNAEWRVDEFLPDKAECPQCHRVYDVEFEESCSEDGEESVSVWLGKEIKGGA